MNAQNWYIVKQENGHCQIVVVREGVVLEEKQSWGPFLSPEEAIARRIGLIRSGKCQPL